MSKIEKDMLRGHLDGLVLSILEKDSGHGYDILKRLREESQDTLQLKEGSLYPALYRLEEAALVKARWDESNAAKSKGPRRRVYSITPKGEKMLGRQREKWTHFSQIIGRIMEAPS
ncbi:MAG: PadR family transcriptional regulator [Candidatus Hydrogenedentota bacterium]|nr:MAG: PadR family transcriptional regulator [Candidatus Hydrogenedentota bacterium]